MQTLIDEAFLQRLANLRFITKGRRKGRLSGLHPSPRAGVSLEFADYRPYAPGDDIRSVDWNVFGRLDRVLVKTYVHEGELPVYLLVDFSASMRVGSPSKALYAARLCAATGYLALRGLDRVGLYPFTDHLLPGIPARHGMRQIGRILRRLIDTVPSGQTSLDHGISEFLAQTREGGLVFLISDFLTPGGYEEGIARLLHRGDEIVVVQVLAPEEIRPTRGGSTQLVDVESDRRLTLTIGRHAVEEYAERLAAHQARLRRFLTERGLPLFIAPTDLPIERLVHEQFRAGGILR